MTALKDKISIATPGSFISRLWRLIVIEDGYYKNIIRLRNNYICKILSESELSNSKFTLNKTNIDNKIVMEEMTWKNFIFLLSEILLVRDMELEFVLEVKTSEKMVQFKTTHKGLDPNMLSKIWSDLKKEISKNTFQDSLEEMLSDYVVRNMDNPNANTRANMQKKITSSVVTWNTLMLLIDELLQASVIKVSLTITHSEGTKTTHTLEYLTRNERI